MVSQIAIGIDPNRCRIRDNYALAFEVELRTDLETKLLSNKLNNYALLWCPNEVVFSFSYVKYYFNFFTRIYVFTIYVLHVKYQYK